MEEDAARAAGRSLHGGPGFAAPVLMAMGLRCAWITDMLNLPELTPVSVVARTHAPTQHCARQKDFGIQPLCACHVGSACAPWVCSGRPCGRDLRKPHQMREAQMGRAQALSPRVTPPAPRPKWPWQGLTSRSGPDTRSRPTSRSRPLGPAAPPREDHAGDQGPAQLAPEVRDPITTFDALENGCAASGQQALIDKALAQQTPRTTRPHDLHLGL